jgi:hypothetical protein
MATQAAPVRRPSRSVRVGRGRQTPHSLIVSHFHKTPEPAKIPPRRYALIKRSDDEFVATRIESHTLIEEATIVGAPSGENQYVCTEHDHVRQTDYGSDHADK